MTPTAYEAPVINGREVRMVARFRPRNDDVDIAGV